MGLALSRMVISLGTGHPQLRTTPDRSANTDDALRHSAGSHFSSLKHAFDSYEPSRACQLNEPYYSCTIYSSQYSTCLLPLHGGSSPNTTCPYDIHCRHLLRLESIGQLQLRTCQLSVGQDVSLQTATCPSFSNVSELAQALNSASRSYCSA